MSAYIPLIAALIGAGGSIAGGLLGRRGSEETPIQERQRQVIDDILESVKGEGPLSDLFKFDEETFQKSFVEPAKERFSSQISPQIQQQFIASGQQRGTPLQDTLTRAGVDLDQMLNQFYAQQQQGAQQRQLGALERILGAGAGAQAPQSFGSALGESASGYLSSPAFGSALDRILEGISSPSRRRGFEADNTGVQS